VIEVKKIVTEEDGTRWIADTQTDEALYTAPHNPPNTGSAYTRGTDLFVHKTRSHGLRYYTRGWSMWQGEQPDIIVPITREEAEKFLVSHVGDYWNFPSDEENTKLKEYGFDILQETA